MGVQPVQVHDICTLTIVALTTLLGHTVHEIAVTDVLKHPADVEIPFLKTADRRARSRFGPASDNPRLDKRQQRCQQFRALFLDRGIEHWVFKATSCLGKVSRDFEVDVHEPTAKVI